MAKPMFFYTWIYGSSADAEMDYAAVKALHGRGAFGSYDSAIIVHCAACEARDIGAMLEPGTAALVVIGIDIDAEAIESVAEHAREHTLKREFGDWDTAEHDVLELMARAEQQAVMP
jgi:hypothetical protein